MAAWCCPSAPTPRPDGQPWAHAGTPPLARFDKRQENAHLGERRQMARARSSACDRLRSELKKSRMPLERRDRSRGNRPAGADRVESVTIHRISHRFGRYGGMS